MDIKDKLSNGIDLKNIEKLSVAIHYPHVEGKKILDTTENLKVLLDVYGISVKYNMMSRSREIIIRNVVNFFDEKENADLNYIYTICVLNHMPTKSLDDHLNSISWQNAFHPVRECILNKPWDGSFRLDKFIKTVKTTNDKFSYKLIKKWMISAIAAAFSEKGFAAQGVLVLQGKQNIGKTRWVKSLSPIGADAVKEGLMIDPSNKDHVITAGQCWIGEIGEIDGTFRKADMARLKSYTTSSGDTVRFPYLRRNSFLARRTVFVATVNDSLYLIDDTGNRRWWTIEVVSINLTHNLDIQQIWAEVYDIWLKDQVTWLLSDEMNELNESNEGHERIDPFFEKLLEKFNWCDEWEKLGTLKMTSTEVLEKIGYERPSIAETTRMGKILTKLCGKPKRGASNRYYMLPLLKINF